LIDRGVVLWGQAASLRQFRIGVMPKISNKRKARMLLDQIEELLRRDTLRPGERRRWQAWHRRVVAILEASSATVSAPSSSISWEKLAFEALYQAGVLATRADDRTTGQVAGQSPKPAVHRTTEDVIERDADFVGRAPVILPITVTIPAKTITVSSPLHLEILRIMSEEGVARSWRIAQRVLAAGLAENENSVRNALRRLTAGGLIDDYRERSKPMGWTPTRGGSRRLVALTETGGMWCTAVFGQVPAASELTQALARHQSVQHGIAVLETRDYLRLAGYRVDDKPQAVLAAVTERWGKRTEPDLLLEMEGKLWTVEVQREVSKRVTAKWEKCITLAGRLALVLLSKDHLAMQRSILQRESSTSRSHLLGIRLASLEEMHRGEWQWYPLDG
jgi:hypothetical protein